MRPCNSKMEKIMRWWMWLLLPMLVEAQEFPYQEEHNSVPVYIEDWFTPVPWGKGFSQSRPTFGDLNGDTLFDVVVGIFTGELFHFENIGTPVLADWQWNDLQLDSIPLIEGWCSPDLADIDSDGDLDLFMTAIMVESSMLVTMVVPSNSISQSFPSNLTI